MKEKLLFIAVGLVVTCMGTIFALVVDWNNDEHVSMVESIELNEKEINNLETKIGIEVEKVKLNVEKSNKLQQKEIQNIQKKQMDLLLDIKEDLGELKGQIR